MTTVDPQQYRRRVRAAVISVLVGLGLFGMKITAYSITGSAAILSDALESVVHVLATSFAFYSVLLSARPADKSHPYGHGRIEFFSAGIEGLLIVLAAIAIIFVAAPKLLDPRGLEDLNIGMAITALAAVVNLLLGWYLIHVGRQEGSLTLVADGKHVLTDSITSFGVIVGLVLVLLTDWLILDPIVAILVAFNIVVTGFKLVRQSVGGLMDEADPDFISRATQALNGRRQAEWIDVHRLRCWKSGETHHLDFHLTLPYYLNVTQAHDVEADLTETLLEALDQPVQLLVHHDPCVPACCSFCAVSDCSVRQNELSDQLRFTADHVVRAAQYLEDSEGTQSTTADST
ncbi:MAG: cation diffusion facilitator family transporter [Planctomycetota bacterium]|nr:cation diffusion facilitator family transporter [Planctomycetota bacterium]